MARGIGFAVVGFRHISAQVPILPHPLLQPTPCMRHQATATTSSNRSSSESSRSSSSHASSRERRTHYPPPTPNIPVPPFLADLEASYAHLYEGQRRLEALAEDCRNNRMDYTQQPHNRTRPWMTRDVADSIHRIGRQVEEIATVLDRKFTPKPKRPRSRPMTLTPPESPSTTVDSELEDAFLRGQWRELLRAQQEAAAQQDSFPTPRQRPTLDLRSPLPRVLIPGLVSPEAWDGPSPTTISAPAIPDIAFRRPQPRRRAPSPGDTISYVTATPSLHDQEELVDEERTERG